MKINVLIMAVTIEINLTLEDILDFFLSTVSYFVSLRSKKGHLQPSYKSHPLFIMTPTNNVQESVI
ncbi:hypothetical protein FBY58_1316 [Zymomonas mobilis]|uniref:Uncharacterized protein n=1 Tax=Zymomonas mobilis TaxID=542 RepID=A0A542W2C2_ZYMMB|nr:hypothetical protein FBY58_1316 [Zymomonas mobilis]